MVFCCNTTKDQVAEHAKQEEAEVSELKRKLSLRSKALLSHKKLSNMNLQNQEADNINVIPHVLKISPLAVQMDQLLQQCKYNPLCFAQVSAELHKTQANTESPPPVLLFPFEIGTASHVGIRKVMEDTLVALPCLNILYNAEEDVSFFAIYDGHLGCSASEFARLLLHDFFMHHFLQHQQVPIVQRIQDALQVAFEKTEKALFQASPSFISGTCALVTVIYHCKTSSDILMVTAYVGDSQALLHSQSGTQTVCMPHYASRDDEKKRISLTGGMVHSFFGQARVNGMLSVTRSIGDVNYAAHVVCAPDFTIHTVNLLEDKYVLMASDGLWDVFNEEQLVQFIESKREANETADQISNALVQQALANNSKDNISVILLVFKK